VLLAPIPRARLRPKGNSEYWRAKLDANVARDRRNDQALRQAGWTVLRLWEHHSTSQMAINALESLRAIRATETTSHNEVS